MNPIKRSTLFVFLLVSAIAVGICVWKFPILKHNEIKVSPETSEVSGECIYVAKNGIVIQQYRLVENETRTPIAGRYTLGGERINPRSMVTGRTTEKVPVKKIFLHNFPDSKKVPIGYPVEILAYEIEPTDILGESLETWECKF